MNKRNKQTSIFPLTGLRYAQLREHMSDEQVKYLAARRHLHDNGFVSNLIEKDLDLRESYPRARRHPPLHITAWMDSLLQVPLDVERQLLARPPVIVFKQPPPIVYDTPVRPFWRWRWRKRLMRLLLTLCLLAAFGRWLGLSIATCHGKSTTMSL